MLIMSFLVANDHFRAEIRTVGEIAVCFSQSIYLEEAFGGER